MKKRRSDQGDSKDTREVRSYDEASRLLKCIGEFCCTKNDAKLYFEVMFAQVRSTSDVLN